MSSDDRIHQGRATRRKMLLATGSATMLGLAGCLGDDDDDGDDTETDPNGDEANGDEPEEPDEQSVVLLAEGAPGDVQYDEGGLPEYNIDHACGHMELDEPEALTGGGTADDAPTIDQTHQPFDVAIDGESAYVRFEADHGDENGEVSTFDIVDRDTDEVTAYVHDDHWDGELPHVHEEAQISLGAEIEDEDGHEIELDGDHYALGVDYYDHDSEDVVSFDEHGDHVYIVGDHHGEAQVVFQLLHDDHVEYETPPITVEVEDENGEEEHDHGEEEHDHEDDDLLAFFTEGGTVEVVTGETLREEDNVEACGDIDTYVVVEPDHGEVVLTVSPE